MRTPEQKQMERENAVRLLDLAQGDQTQDPTRKNRNAVALINTLQTITGMTTPPSRPSDWETLTEKGEVLREAATYFWPIWNVEERLWWLRVGEHKLHIGQTPTATGLPLARTGVRTANDIPHMCVRMILRRVFGTKIERVHWWSVLEGVEKQILYEIIPIDYNVWHSASGVLEADRSMAMTSGQTQQGDSLFNDDEDIFATPSTSAYIGSHNATPDVSSASTPGYAYPPVSTNTLNSISHASATSSTPTPRFSGVSPDFELQADTTVRQAPMSIPVPASRSARVSPRFEPQADTAVHQAPVSVLVPASGFAGVPPGFESQASLTLRRVPAFYNTSPPTVDTARTVYPSASSPAMSVVDLTMGNTSPPVRAADDQALQSQDQVLEIKTLSIADRIVVTGLTGANMEGPVFHRVLQEVYTIIGSSGSEMPTEGRMRVLAKQRLQSQLITIPENPERSTAIIWTQTRNALMQIHRNLSSNTAWVLAANIHKLNLTF